MALLCFSTPLPLFYILRSYLCLPLIYRRKSYINIIFFNYITGYRPLYKTVVMTVSSPPPPPLKLGSYVIRVSNSEINTRWWTQVKSELYVQTTQDVVSDIHVTECVVMLFCKLLAGEGRCYLNNKMEAFLIPMWRCKKILHLFVTPYIQKSWDFFVRPNRCHIKIVSHTYSIE